MASSETLIWTEFRHVLALADAFGFRPLESFWYVQPLDREPLTPELRWWELAAPPYDRFSAREAKLLEKALARAHDWLEEMPDDVPESANMFNAGRFYELQKFIRGGRALECVCLVRDIALKGPLRWDFAYQTMIWTQDGS